MLWGRGENKWGTSLSFHLPARHPVSFFSHDSTSPLPFPFHQLSPYSIPSLPHSMSPPISLTWGRLALVAYNSLFLLHPYCLSYTPRCLSHSVHYSRMLLHHFTAHCQRWDWVISCCWGSMWEGRPMDKAFTGRLEHQSLIDKQAWICDHTATPLVEHLLFSTLALELQINNHIFILYFFSRNIYAWDNATGRTITTES